MIDLLTIQPSEAERIAYSEGFTMAATLFARIADLEAERDTLADEVETLRDKVCKAESDHAHLKDQILALGGAE